MGNENFLDVFDSLTIQKTADWATNLRQRDQLGRSDVLDAMKLGSMEATGDPQSTGIKDPFDNPNVNVPDTMKSRTSGTLGAGVNALGDPDTDLKRRFDRSYLSAG